MEYSQSPSKRRRTLPVLLLPLKHLKYIVDKHKTLAKNKEGNPEKSRTNQRLIHNLSTTYPHTAGDSLFCYPFYCEYFILLHEVSIVLMGIVHFVSARCCGSMAWLRGLWLVRVWGLSFLSLNLLTYSFDLFLSSILRFAYFVCMYSNIHIRTFVGGESKPKTSKAIKSNS